MKEPTLYPSYYTIAGDIIPVGKPISASPFSLEERVREVSLSGFNGIGLQFDDIKESLKKYSPQEISALFKQNELAHIDFELFTDWVYCSYDVESEAKDLVSFLDLSQKIGVKTIKIAAELPPLKLNLSNKEYVQKLKSLSRFIENYDLILNLEFMPFSGIKNLKNAYEIITELDHPQIKLLIDIWHIERANTPLEEILKIDPLYIGAVEIGDAYMTYDKDLLVDSYRNRLIPGEGDFNLSLFIKYLLKINYDGPWGVEIISEDFRKRPLKQLSQISYQSLKSILAENT